MQLPLLKASLGLLLGAFVVGVWWMAQGPDVADAARRYYYQQAFNEALPLQERYGPSKFSRNLEEWIVRDFFQDKRGGVFADVGANHYQNENNTYYLESKLAWSGVAVDALAAFAADYQAHRPRTVFVAGFVSDVDGERVTFYVPQGNSLVASASKEFTVREGHPGEPTQIGTVTLNTILQQAAIKEIDFLSMDIELAEPSALRGFDIDRYRPRLVCIEAHPDVRQFILDYFHQAGYVVVGKYLRVDVSNLYFTPVS